ncbi:MAG: CAP domain-containing protein [Puniceicoccaceae bacterium]|nr:MAG: CAP domain-containing protein [Puniceicoccaceae bacterium]
MNLMTDLRMTAPVFPPAPRVFALALGLLFAGLPLALAQPSHAPEPQLGDGPWAPPAPPEGVSRIADNGEDPGLVVDVDSRAAARAFYLGVYRASVGVPIEWDGDVAAGDKGTTSAHFKFSVLRRANYFRAMAGLTGNLVLRQEYSDKAQDMALMISANNGLTHFPPDTWTWYTEDGREAAEKSNLALGRFGADAISLGYMKDPGANNDAVGHRRWILLPQLRNVGTGDIPSGDQIAANVFWVVDEDSIFDPRGEPRDGFVAWPPPGHVPYQVVYPRWSLSHAGADFSNADVTLTGPDGQDIPLVIDHRSTSGGLPEPTIVWRPDGMSDNANWDVPAEDETYTVSVTGVDINGQSQDFNYSVTVFDPAILGPDFVTAELTPGPGGPLVGHPHTYTLTLPPYAEGYEVRSGRLVPYDHVEGAEDGLVHVLVSSSGGYDVINPNVRHSGTSSFQLAHPVFENQWIEIDRTIVPGASAELRFWSRLATASENQVARVQVSRDDGTSWNTHYEQAGSGHPGESTFHLRTVQLGGYAGETIRVRFLYARAQSGSFFPQSDNSTGWFIDEITISGAQELVDETVFGVQAATSFNHTATSTDPFILQVRPAAWDVPLEWGTVLSLTASDGSPPPPSTARPVNVSTRGFVGTGAEIMIGGFVLEGTGTTRVLIRGTGPGLAQFLDPDSLLELPWLRLFEGGDLLEENIRWSEADRAAEIALTAFAPDDPDDAALLVDLPPGVYTAHVRGGTAGDTGIGRVEVFMLDPIDGEPTTALPVNLSTRGFVGTGNDRIIGGFVIQGQGDRDVLIRGLGPGLKAFFPESQHDLLLGQPELRLMNAQGQMMEMNVGWQTHPRAAEIEASPFTPADEEDSAILATLPPGVYTAIVAGVGQTTGIGIVEVFILPLD